VQSILKKDPLGFEWREAEHQRVIRIVWLAVWKDIPASGSHIAHRCVGDLVVLDLVL